MLYYWGFGCNYYVSCLTDKPERTELTVNTRTHNLTLNESDRADFKCHTHGRPSPSMQLVNVTSGQGIQSTAGGDVTVEDKVTWLNHSLTAVCQHTGHYNCDVSNSVGNGPRGQVSLFVNCKCMWWRKSELINFADILCLILKHNKKMTINLCFMFNFHSPVIIFPALICVVSLSLVQTITY